jgi:hypothetical protein
MTAVLKIDELLRRDHYYLRDEDDCYYHMEYASRKGYEHSDANNLIHNFKKPVKYKGTPSWKYKQQAIRRIGELYKTSLEGLIDFDQVTIIPVPPSKMKVHKDYDSRLLDMVNWWTQDSHADVREVIRMTESIDALHESDSRLSPDELLQFIDLDPALLEDVRDEIVLLDDVITTGAHFVACKSLLADAFPGANIRGVFLARTIWVRPTAEEDFRDLLGEDD